MKFRGKLAAALVLCTTILCGTLTQAAAASQGDQGVVQLSADAARHPSTLRLRALLQEGSGDSGGAGPSGIAAWNPRVHGYTAAISLGLVAPLAAVVSRSFREFRPLWFYVHAPLGLAAFIGGVVGVVFGSKLPEDGLVATTYDAHKAIGGLALAFAGLQICAIVLRPRLDHPKRFIFNHFHHWSGRLAIAFGIANVFIGLHLADELSKFYWGYAIVLGAIVLLWVTKETVDFARVSANNRLLRKGGYEGRTLPYPLNGGFAATFLQRPPPGVPVAKYGHGPLPQSAADVEASAPTKGGALLGHGKPPGGRGGRTPSLEMRRVAPVDE